ncbi:MAG: 50S ribosomal protein L21 [Rubricella sp.]
MFAVIKTGGKQYKVAKDDVLTIEKLDGEAGDAVDFTDVLMIGGETLTVGTPMIEGAVVKAEVLDQTRGEKVISFKKRRRKHSSQRRKGHRQYLTVVKVTDILASGAKKAAPKAKAKAEAAPAPAAAATEATGTRPANLLDAPKGEADDLKKISGVGPALLKKLNGLGIYHFWQIAEWGADEIAFVDNELSFKGRIERDNWIAQAKEFAAETSGE